MRFLKVIALATFFVLPLTAQTCPQIPAEICDELPESPLEDLCDRAD